MIRHLIFAILTLIFLVMLKGKTQFLPQLNVKTEGFSPWSLADFLMVRKK